MKDETTKEVKLEGGSPAKGLNIHKEDLVKGKGGIRG